MKWFPKKSKIAGVRLPRKSRMVQDRWRQKDGEEPITFRDEFDMLIKETYNGLSNQDKNILWQKIGSILITHNLSGSAKDRLKLALKISQETAN
jgi:hypothetical protein